MAKFCTNCGSEIKPGAKFCENCGQKLEQEQKPQEGAGGIAAAAGAAGAVGAAGAASGADTSYKKASVTAMVILRRELMLMLRRQIMIPIVRQIPIIILLPIISKSLRMNILAARMITVLPLIIHRPKQARSF